MAKLFVAQRDIPMFDRIRIEAHRFFDPDTIAEALKIVEHTGVTHFFVSDEWQVSTMVGDAKPLARNRRSVLLNLTDLPESQCSCSDEGYCSHLIALLIEVYRKFHLSVKDITVIPPNAERTDVNHAGSAKRSTSKQKPAADAEPQINADSLEQATVEQWTHFFESKYKLTTITESFSFEHLNQVWKPELLRYAKQFPPQIRALYTAHVLLYLIRLAEMAISQMSGKYYIYLLNKDHYDKVNHIWISELVQGLNGSGLRHGEGITARRIRETQEMLREIVFGKSSRWMNQLLLYRLFWWHLLYTPERAAREIQWLATELDKASKGSDKESKLLAARGHLYVLQNQDSQAWMHFQNHLQCVTLYDLMLYARQFNANKENDRAIDWLKNLLPLLREEGDEEEREDFLEFWNVVLGTDHPDYLQALNALLPHSYPYFSGSALRLGNFKLWAEVQLLCNYSPDEIENRELRIVGQKAPDALLPLYHLNIVQFIEMKNRDGYSRAADLLLELRKLFLKLHRQEAWTIYINQLTDRYSRLRAFQEQLRSLKLLP